MEAYRVGLLEILTKGDIFSWHILFVLLIWNVDMTPRDAAVILGDEKESQVMRVVEHKGRRMLGLCDHHGASVPGLTCQSLDHLLTEKKKLLFG